MESGTPGRKATADGWMNRALLRTRATYASPVRAVSLGADAAALHARAERCGRDQQPERFPGAGRARRRHVREHVRNDARHQVLNGTGRETFEAVKLLQSIQTAALRAGERRRISGRTLGQA